MCIRDRAWGLCAAAEKAGLPLFCGSYPITPATVILEELAKRKDLGENQEEPLFYDTLIVKTKRSSKKERRADALALRADERRDKLR